VTDRRGVRAGVPIAGERAVDDPGVVLTEAFVVDPQSLGNAGAKPLYEHVTVGDESVKRLATRVGFQIDRNASLAPVHRIEQRADPPLGVRRHRPCVITPVRVLDFDDLGSAVGEQLGRIRTRKQARQIEYPDAIESHDTIRHTLDLVSCHVRFVPGGL
jgi:hypothetical protein